MIGWLAGWPALVFLVWLCCRRFPFEPKRQHVYYKSAPPHLPCSPCGCGSRPTRPHLFPFFRSAAFCVAFRRGSRVLSFLRSARILPSLQEYSLIPVPCSFLADQPDPISRREERGGRDLPSVKLSSVAVVVVVERFDFGSISCGTTARRGKDLSSGFRAPATSTSA